MAKTNWNYIVTDFETGGLSAEKNPITEVALIVLSGDTLKELERYETFIKPYGTALEYNPQALQITGITMQQINSGKDHKDVVKEMINLYEKYTNGKGRFKQRPIFAAHNGDNFDINFLEMLFNLAGKDIYEYIEKHTEDTMWMARNFWQGEDIEQKYNLGVCCEKAGISLVDAHRAMNDTQATAELFKFFINKMRSKTGDVVVKQQEKEFVFWRDKVDFKF